MRMVSADDYSVSSWGLCLTAMIMLDHVKTIFDNDNILSRGWCFIMRMMLDRDDKV